MECEQPIGLMWSVPGWLGLFYAKVPCEYIAFSFILSNILTCVNKSNLGAAFLEYSLQQSPVGWQSEITFLYLASFPLISYWLSTLINLQVCLCTSTTAVSSWQLILFLFIIIKCCALQLPKASSRGWAQNMITQQMGFVFCVTHTEILDFNESQKLKRVQFHLDSTHSSAQASVRTKKRERGHLAVIQHHNTEQRLSWVILRQGKVKCTTFSSLKG